MDIEYWAKFKQKHPSPDWKIKIPDDILKYFKSLIQILFFFL